MNILFVYHEYGDGRWLQYTRALERLGHRVDIERLRSKWEPDQIAFSRVSSAHQIVWINSADYVWHQAVPRAFLDAVKSSGRPLIGYFTLKADVALGEWFELYRPFDLCFVQSKSVTEAARRHGLTNVEHLPYGFDPLTYQRLDVPKDIRVSFAGTPELARPVAEDRRARILDALRPFGVQAFGARFAGRLDPSIPVHPFQTNQEMNLIYNRSRINVDIPSVVSDVAEIGATYHPKFRLFDVPGSGNFLLGGYAEEFEEAFQGGVQCAYYRDLDGLLAQVDHFLTHERERVEIERAGFAHAHAHHTQEAYLRGAMALVEERFFHRAAGGRGT